MWEVEGFTSKAAWDKDVAEYVANLLKPQKIFDSDITVPLHALSSNPLKRKGGPGEGKEGTEGKKNTFFHDWPPLSHMDLKPANILVDEWSQNKTDLIRVRF